MIVQDLTEQRHSGSNPDYGLPTPTLVSPPKGSKNISSNKLGGMAPSNLEIALLKQYPFDSAVQRMTVVAKKKGAQYYSVFMKGAPEKVASFCRSETSKSFVCFPRCEKQILFSPSLSPLISPGRVQQLVTVLHQTRIPSHRSCQQESQGFIVNPNLVL